MMIILLTKFVRPPIFLSLTGKIKKKKNDETKKEIWLKFLFFIFILSAEKPKNYVIVAYHHSFIFQCHLICKLRTFGLYIMSNMLYFIPHYLFKSKKRNIC